MFMEYVKICERVNKANKQIQINYTGQENNRIFNLSLNFYLNPDRNGLQSTMVSPDFFLTV